MTPLGQGGSGESPEQAAARLTGRQVRGVRPQSGALTEVVLGDGRAVMVKRGRDPHAVRAEAAGLRWLDDAGRCPYRGCTAATGTGW